MPAGLLTDVFLRSLVLQGSWNSQRMQNLGFLVCLLPWLRRHHRSRGARRRFCRRHYEYFNTNPYLASLILGGTLRLESDSSHDKSSERMIARFKDSLARSTASLGDQLFWLGLRPTLMLLACILGFWGQVWPVFGVILVFAVVQLESRRRLLVAGYRQGLDIVDLLGKPGWHRAIAVTKRCGMLLAGVLLGCYLGRGPVDGASASIPQVCGTVGVGIVIALYLKKRVPPELVFLVGGPLVLLLTYV